MIDTRNYSAPDKLKDGTPVTVRAIRAGDREAIAAAFAELDRDSIYTRFFTYKKQLTETDDAKRADYVKQAQARLYSQFPTIVLDYQNALEAYRSDKFSAFTTQPQPKGAILEQTGYWGVYGATPAGTEATADSGSSGTVVWIVVGAIVVVIIVVGGVVISRRTKTTEDRE